MLTAANNSSAQHFWRGSIQWGCLVFRTSQPLKNSMYSPKAIFHPQYKGPKLSGRHWLLSFPSSVDSYNYHKCTREPKMESLTSCTWIYLLLFQLTTQQGISYSFGWHIQSLSLSLLVSLSLCIETVFILWLPARRTKKSILLFAKGNKIAAETKMSKKPFLLPNN